MVTCPNAQYCMIWTTMWVAGGAPPRAYSNTTSAAAVRCWQKMDRISLAESWCGPVWYENELQKEKGKKKEGN